MKPILFILPGLVILLACNRSEERDSVSVEPLSQSLPTDSELAFPLEYDQPEFLKFDTEPANAADPSSFPVTPDCPTAFETRNTGVTLMIDPVPVEEADATDPISECPENED